MNQSPGREFLRSCWKNRNFVIGFIIVSSLLFAAAFADVITPYDYDEPHKQDRLHAPSLQYPFGTDDFGRDMFSRIIYGVRITLQIAAIGVTIQLVLGVTVGLLCGFFGGVVDRVLMFIADITWCIPGMVLALAVVTLLGKGLTNSIIAISIVNWAQYARTVRAKTMSIKNMAFIETGVAFGERAPALMFRYILPNVVPALIVMISTQLPSTIVSTTALSFLGLGSQPPSPDWGLALSNGVSYLNRAPWLSIFPGLALVYTVFGFNLLGEGLRDLLDPRMQSM
ncbi:ABC transporter permease [Eubacteriales bacterium OttesenSCG-928-A19]|nr:ABC transporter permease [Eubacteriales bacterium OttesenSCG-928-A19]